MVRDEDKAAVGERLTGVRDPKDPDGLITLEDLEKGTDPTRYGTPEADQA